MNLHLTLTKNWFDLILSGEKKEEYREIKPYWEKLLMGKTYDKVKKYHPRHRKERMGCRRRKKILCT